MGEEPASSNAAASGGPVREGTRPGFKRQASAPPKWTMAEKPKMVIGGPVPSWQASIPGPQYNYSTDNFKHKQPVYSMRGKPEMVIGGGVPSWIKSIPGPQYSYDTDSFKERQPVYSIRGRGEEKKSRSETAPAPATTEALMRGIDASRKKPPAWSVKSRPAMVSGDAVPSWVASIPGPKYHPPCDTFKKKQPVYSMGGKLPSESDLMKVRSPGPMRYGGPAMNSKEQEKCDSTRQKSFSCSFGVGPRWSGPTAELVTTGALARFDRPCL
ncbi:unnamed protein product [Effrenium voratum]|uniref:Uncharacterized protein n=1 Tax=Effrenium voratum TaxID=2562239 RepID=A0AA36MPY4_9DINO|nr:unnamed protein product [Effrenium voratum]CAJ1375733.1 unnamed protein product [Effrenium voratum]CAJ1445487.1 unnamed protein product [Effrenium voratum]